MGVNVCLHLTVYIPPLPRLTLALLLTHDGVTEGEQAEKLVRVCVSHFHRFQQGVVVETEVWVRQGVEGSEVQSLKIKRRAKDFGDVS